MRYRPSRPRRTFVVLLVLVAVVGAFVYVTGTTFLSRPGAPPPPPRPPDAPDLPAESLVGGQPVRAFFEVEDEGEETIEARLEVALGRVTTGQAERGTLFQAEVALASDRLRPRFEHTTRGDQARVELGLHGGDVSFRGVRATRGNLWRLYFSGRTPLDLHLDLGAAEADLDLTGIPLQRLALTAGMAGATLRFNEANPVVAERIEVEAGLSSFTARGLGLARFREFDFDGGVGEFTLDFSGDAFQDGARATIDVGMASLTVLLPEGRPVRLGAPSSFVTHVEVPPRFAAIGRGRWASPDAEHDPAAFEIDINAGPGKVEVRLVE